MHYEIEDDNLRRMSRNNFGTGVEQLKPRTEGNSYKSMSKKIQLFMKNDTCTKKQTQETMK